MNRWIGLVLLAAAGCGDDDDDGLGSALVDCTADDALCDSITEARCSVRLNAVDANGEVVGICGGGEDDRACTILCADDGECPTGWTCMLPERCPGEGSVRYCVPAGSTLADQGLPDCRAEASPRVCGF